MLGPEVRQLDMADGGIDTLQQLPVTVQGRGADACTFLQFQGIGGILGEGLAIVQGIALLHAPLEVRSGPLDGFFRLAGRHAGAGLKVHPVADAAALSIEAPGDGDAV